MITTETASYKTVLVFGDKADRVIETVGTTKDGQTFELGYYNGDDKLKPIINISPAVGCPIGCNFCDLTEQGRLLSVKEISSQVDIMVELAKMVDGVDLHLQPFKVNIAKTGDPAFNHQLITAMKEICATYDQVSFKYSTSMPHVSFLNAQMCELAAFASSHKGGTTQLQISLISTDENFRRHSAKGRLAPFKDIRAAIDTWYAKNPSGRIPNCSLLVAQETPCIPEQIINALPPSLIKMRIRKIVPTAHSLRCGLSEATNQKIQNILAAFTKAGYDINTAGLPSRTEAMHGLASNVTRRKLKHEYGQEGICFVAATP